MKSNAKFFIALLAFGGVASLGLCIAAGVGIFYWQFAFDVLKPEKAPAAQEVAREEVIEVKDTYVRFMDKELKQRTLLMDELNHGTQFVNPPPGEFGPDNPGRLPTMYWHPAGPVGLALMRTQWASPRSHLPQSDLFKLASIPPFAGLAALGSPWPVLSVFCTDAPMAVVTMDAGTLAAYARPFQYVDFYERSADIERLSLPQGAELPKFTYIKDAMQRGANIRVFVGNERTTFEKRAPLAFYQYIFVETGRGPGGTISKELITQEAMKRYLASLAEHGMICFHTSNREYQVGKIVASVAASLDCSHVVVFDDSDEMPAHATSEWTFVARRPEHLQNFSKLALDAFKHQHPNRRDDFRVTTEPLRADLVWRDGAANTLEVARFK